VGRAAEHGQAHHRRRGRRGPRRRDDARHLLRHGRRRRRRDLRLSRDFAHLHRVIGRYRAFDLLFTARTFSAYEALGLGLVSRVAPEALPAAMDAARVIAAKSPSAIAFSRAAFHREADRDYTDAVARAVDDFCALAASPQAQEGLRAFLDKRPPDWNAQ